VPANGCRQRGQHHDRKAARLATRKTIDAMNPYAPPKMESGSAAIDAANAAIRRILSPFHWPL